MLLGSCNESQRLVVLWQVKLWCDCPFWPDDGMCRLRDCSVCECPESEFPELFKKPHRLPLDDLICQEGNPQAAVDRTVDRKAFRGWTETDNPWTNDDETDNGLSFHVYEFFKTAFHFILVNLQNNISLCWSTITSSHN